ncbi:high mobility group protein 20A [Bradysia coprophila]|uniref:high mobility group protein 20A n=1 Tax=Bradysia coprophila TaxID=38358 RepID=UPI00187D917B|nr:high mobility group protein 20A [Bradysia coprophila]
MENNENNSGELNDEKPKMSVQKSKLKIKRFRRKDGEKKKKKDPNTPKHPLTGYIRYMNVRREELKKVKPESTAIELTKIIGEEWNALSDDLKKPYLEAAELDKERYHKEYAIYEANKAADQSSPEKPEHSPIHTKTNGTSTKSEKKPDKIKSEKKPDEPEKEKQPEKRQEKLPLKEPPPKLPRIGDYDIPIFTEEFLDHNKTVDTELRLLRKSNTDYEQQNSVLEKHVENIRNGISKLESETNALKENNQLLETYITKLRMKLTTALAGLSIPGETEPCNLQNIDRYMTILQQMATNSHGPASLNKAKDIVRKLDLQIPL